MKYKITGYVKTSSIYHDGKICKYETDIIPHIDEDIYLPHKGIYRVTNVIYNISDDGNEYNNNVMFVDLFLKPTTLY